LSFKVEVKFSRKNRNLDTIDQLVEKAKLNKNELYPIVQTVYLGKNLAADNLKLMEIDEEKLNYLLEGNR